MGLNLSNMIKIIKQGVKEFHITCPYCGCEFTYENEDVCNSEVICPCCSINLPHKGVIGTVNTNPSQMPIWYNQQIAPDGYKIRDGLNNPLPSWATALDRSGCEGCPNNPKYLKTPYVGDTPCQWCQKNPNKVTCTSNASKGEIK